MDKLVIVMKKKKMKTQFIWIVSIILLGVCTACEKFNKDELIKKQNELPGVSDFVAQLKKGTYDKDMPPYTDDDISELLKYAGDTTHISYFPFNPVSSIKPGALRGNGEFILAECILSVIECIRMDFLSPAYLPLTFPMGVFEKSESSDVGQTKPHLSGQELLVIKDLYQKWWKENQGGEWKLVNPLNGTSYEWDFPIFVE